MSDVFQTDDRYAGPVMGGRYQVLASAIGPTFYVYDHVKADQVRTEANYIRRFEKIFDAISFLGFTIQEIEDMKILSTQDVEKQEIEMAKAVKVSDAMAKAQVSMAARVAAKRIAADAKSAKKAAAPKTVKAIAPPKVVVLPTKSRSQAAMFRQMITEGRLSDKDMIAEARAAFPDKKVVDSSVSFYRARMG